MPAEGLQTSINTWGPWQFLIALVIDVFSKPCVNCVQLPYACETLHRALKAPQSQWKLPFAVYVYTSSANRMFSQCNKSRMYLKICLLNSANMAKTKLNFLDIPKDYFQMGFSLIHFSSLCKVHHIYTFYFPHLS